MTIYKIQTHGKLHVRCMRTPITKLMRAARDRQSPTGPRWTEDNLVSTYAASATADWSAVSALSDHQSVAQLDITLGEDLSLHPLDLLGDFH